MVRIVNVVGTRPNFIKIAPLVKLMKGSSGIEQLLVHTGQHYDSTMSKLFFDDLGIPKPDVNLGVGSASDAVQTAKIMIAFEKALSRENPDLVVVVGDVNSTFAAALTTKKLGIRVAHVESGLRSFDMQMPEEINRILTDHISDFLFTTEKSGNENLDAEGINKNKVFFVGNVMIDTLLAHKKESEKSNILSKLNLSKQTYAVATLHRPSNVDTFESLSYTSDLLDSIQNKIKLVFPVHPRTMKNLKKFNMYSAIKNKKNIILTEPLGYLDFLCIMANSKFVLTDSGGIQEETTVLGIPCITFRNNTERPVTVEQGTNLIVSTDKDRIASAADKLIAGKISIKSKVPELWDGKAAERIVEILLSKL